MADSPEHQDITDAITDGPQAQAMIPDDGAATTGVPIVEPEMQSDDRSTATPPVAEVDDDDDDTDEVLTEDLSVQGGE
jgi:hypothetical protein